MSRQRTQSPRNVSAAGLNDLQPPANAATRLALALAWLILFCIWFYSFGLPNNRPAERWMVWSAIPFELLDLLDPPVEANAPAWSWLCLTQRAPFLGIACVVWAGAVCVGRLELRGLRISSQFDRAEQLFFAGCLGLSTISLLMLGLGLAGVLNRWPLLILLLGVVLAELWFIRRDGRSNGHMTGNQANEKPTNSVRLPWIVWAIATPFVVSMLLGAMSPQTDFDVIEYHLGGPKEWFLQGRITRLPHNVYTSFPFLTEMLLLSGMVLYGGWEWGALAGQAIVAGFAPLTAIGLFATGRRWFSTNAGWLAALVWLTTPWVYRISIISYAEGGLACYLFAAFAVALRIVWANHSAVAQQSVGEHQQSCPPNAPLALPMAMYGLCGLLAGSAMACKYTGLISVVVPVGLLLAAHAARCCAGSGRVKQFLVAAALFGSGVLISVGPWLLKNSVETGNPVFPLGFSIFGGQGRDAIMNDQWARGHSRHYRDLSERLRDLPVKLTDVVANNDWHSALMFGLAPIALLASWRKKVWLVWAFIGWQFMSWFLFTHQIDRFYVPMFPAVALLAGCGASWLFTFPLGRRCGGLLIAASILFNVWIMRNIGGFNAGRTDLQVAEQLITSPSIRWMNEEFESGRLPQTFKVLCVGEAALFHARFPYVYNTVFDRSLFELWCADRSESGEFRLKPSEQIRAALQQHGITHVLVNWSEILRYRESGSYGYTDFAHPDRFAELQAAGVLAAPLPLPDAAAFATANESKRLQVKEWAPSLARSLADHPGYQAVQFFPVKQ